VGGALDALHGLHQSDGENVQKTGVKLVAIVTLGGQLTTGPVSDVQVLVVRAVATFPHTLLAVIV